MVERNILRLPVLLVWLAAGPVVGETLQLPAFSETVDVRVVNLEVVATRRGERLPGLVVGDFRLLVDGVETPIEFFTEVAGGRAAAATSSGPPALVPGQAVGTRYLVFVDDDFAIPSSRNWVLRELADQAARLDEEDSMAIVAFDGRGLDLLTGWTRSLSRLHAAFEEAQQRRAFGLLRLSEQRRALPQGRWGPSAPAGASFSGTGFHGLGRTLAGTRDPEELRYDDVHGKISRVVRAAASTMHGLGGAEPGRKVMLLLAGGWPTFPRWGADAIERMESDRQLFAPLIETANRLGYTLYPVDLQGQRALGPAANRARAAGDLERDRLAEDALFHLAEETGGRTLLGGARLTALERVIDDTRSYYWLGFTPSWRQDGSEHRVKIELRPEEARARARRSFSDTTRRTEVSRWLESAHLFDAPLPGTEGLGVRLGPPRSGGAGRIVVPLALEVPLDRVTLAPHEGGYESRLELRVAATDGEGSSADVAAVEVLLSGAEPPAAGVVSTYETSLRLRDRPHRLLISLYDPASGKVLSKRIDFDP